MSDDASALKRERMDVGDTELLRTINNSWCNAAGVVDPAAFNLSPADRKDLNRLSIARSDATTPEQAYVDRAERIKARCDTNGREYKPPAGVLAVTVDEVESAEIKSSEGSRTPLTVWDDSMNDNRSDYHGHIDFNEVPGDDRGLCLLAAKTMLAKAQARGWKFRPVEPSE
ncbi:endo-1,4-beta-xylanase [Rhodococcus qingshengii]|uniref:Endo-1,4-beta-xylanase n=1 Tax=Rhodococcus qingshengii TaxID=334542 RepID=A0AAW6LX20_RHOSG|nr:endo-1,4-beta-xylanase [Rhodococcus qingshengii]MDE8649485.1 endo-1,4-beta-xylanase [Rhodococcus qingshengii]